VTISVLSGIGTRNLNALATDASNGNNLSLVEDVYFFIVNKGNKVLAQGECEITAF
jgi:hypothetical protein